MGALTESRREVLVAIATATSLPIAFDIGLKLSITTRQAAARLRAAEKDGQVASWRPPEGSEDSDTYWELTPAGKALISTESGDQPKGEGR